MTSLIKTTAVNTKVFPHVQFAGGPYYHRSDDPQYLLFPFTYKSGTLEINPINGFDIENEGPPLGVGVGVEGRGLVRRLGGSHLVQSIGPNFITYIQNVVWQTSTPVSYKATNIKVYQPGIVTRVQQLSSRNLPLTINPAPNSYVSSSQPPTDDFTLGTVAFGSTYAFEKPLVLVVDAALSDSPYTSLGKQYITFYTSWDN